MLYQPLNHLNTGKFMHFSLPIVTALSLLTAPMMSMADEIVKGYCQENPEAEDCQRPQRPIKCNPEEEGCELPEMSEEMKEKMAYCQENPEAEDCQRPQRPIKCNPEEEGCELPEMSEEMKEKMAYCQENPEAEDCQRPQHHQAQPKKPIFHKGNKCKRDPEYCQKPGPGLLELAKGRLHLPVIKVPHPDGSTGDHYEAYLQMSEDGMSFTIEEITSLDGDDDDAAAAEE